jgi:hypothetical protein
MIIDFNLTVTPQTLHLTVPQADHDIEVLNSVVLNPVTRKVYGVGDAKEVVKERLGERWQEAKNDLKFMEAFAEEEADPELDKFILWRFMTDAHKQVRKSTGFRNLLQRLQDRYNFNLSLPNYAGFSADRQQALVNFLQADLRAQTVLINQNRVDIPLKLRRLETYGRLFFTLLLPYLLIAGGVLAALSRPELNLFTTLILVFLLGVAMEMIGKALWMIVMRRFLPASYLRHFLPRLPLPGLTRRMANLLLPE